MTVSAAPRRQLGSPATLQAVFDPTSALAMKPFIPPSAKHRLNEDALCGPPLFLSVGSW